MPRGFLLLLLLAAIGCGDDDGGADDPGFPADYATSYTLVRDCRMSADHDLSLVRVFADPVAAPAYQNRDRPFPAGAVVVKELYDFGDTTCAGPIREWAVMIRLPDGSSPDTIDWRWRKVDLDRRVIAEDDARCIGCHSDCGVPPDGYLGTCTAPP